MRPWQSVLLLGEHEIAKDARGMDAWDDAKMLQTNPLRPPSELLSGCRKFGSAVFPASHANEATLCEGEEPGSSSSLNDAREQSTSSRQLMTRVCLCIPRRTSCPSNTSPRRIADTLKMLHPAFSRNECCVHSNPSTPCPWSKYSLRHRLRLSWAVPGGNEPIRAGIRRVLLT